MSDTEDQPMDDTEVQDEGAEKSVEEKSEKKKFVRREIPLYLTCRLCSGIYKRAVKLACCKPSNACRACAVTNLAANKKCWNPKCGKAAVAADLINDDATRGKVEVHAEREEKFKEGLKTGDILKCPVCEEICKRGVTLPCCGAAACRGCAVKKLAVKRGCWLEGCETIGVTGEELVNDELLRSAIESYKKEGIVDEEQARELGWNKGKLKRVKNSKASKKQKSEKKKDDKKAKKDDSPNQRRDPPKDKVAEEKQVTTIELHITGIPDDTSTEDIKEAFAKFGEIEQVTQQAKMKTATVACGDIKTANSILEQKDGIKMGESSLKIELAKSTKCGELGLYLTGMASDTSEEDLKDFLSNYGSVTDFKLGKTKSEERVYAIVNFEAGLSVRKLINEKEVVLNGEKIKVALKNQKLQNKRPEKTAVKVIDVSKPTIAVRGIFLKKDEAGILKLLEQFGKIEESKFFTKDLETIPPNAAKMNAKERKKLVSRAEIQFTKHIMALKAIGKEKLVYKGQNISIAYKQGTGNEAFKTKVTEKMAAKLKEKAAAKLKEKKGPMKPQGDVRRPQGDMRRVVGFNSAMKRDNRGMWQGGNNGGNVWQMQNQRDSAPPPFQSGMSNGRGFVDNGHDNMDMVRQNMEMRMRNELMKQSMGGNNFFGGYGGAGGMESNGGGWRNDNESGGMWSRRDEGMGQNGGGMGQNGGGMGQNGRGMGQNGGGIDMRKPSKFNQDFRSVTGMSGPAKESVANRPSTFDSGMSSQRMGTDFNLGSSSSMRGMSGQGGSGYGMGGGAYGGRSGGSWGNGGGGGRFPQDMDQVPRKMRRF